MESFMILDLLWYSSFCFKCFDSLDYYVSLCHYFSGTLKVQYNTIQYNTIQYNTIQYNTIQYNTIQYNTTNLYCPGPGN